MLRASKFVLKYALNNSRPCTSLFAERSSVTSDRISTQPRTRHSAALLDRGYNTTVARKQNNNDVQPRQPTKTELVSENWIKTNYTLETRDDDHVIGRGKTNKNKRVQQQLEEEFVPPQMPRLYERLSKSAIQLGEDYYSHKSLSEEQIKEQLYLEMEAVEREAKKFKELVDDVLKLNRGACLDPGTELLLQWFQPLVKLLDLEKQLSLADPGVHQELRASVEALGVLYNEQYLHEYHAHINEVASDKLAVIVIHELIGAAAGLKEQSPVRSVVQQISEAVQGEVNWQDLKDELENPAESRATPDSAENPSGTVPAKKKKRVVNFTSVNRLNRRALKVLGSEALWSRGLKEFMGARLLALLLSVAQLREEDPVTGIFHARPAFDVSHRTQHRKEGMDSTHNPSRLSVSASEAVRARFDAMMTHFFHFIRQYPMQIPPRPWDSPDRGGYLAVQVPIIRYQSYEEQFRPLFRKSDDLAVIYEGLNALGETPWRINQRVYHVVKRAWEQGGDLADIPDRRDKPYPMPTALGKDSRWYRQLKKIDQLNYDLVSLRADFLLKMEVAEKFMDKTLYFPHNMDFRGRVYPVPPHLNHMGSDMSRGLLWFADGKPLGERGLHWLRIQLANLYGFDKVPFSDRLDFVSKNQDKIYSCAQRPLEDRWWVAADSPWQFLAACFEYYNAMHSADPHSYVSHLPIQQDGTCNGLQHYAALGGDEQGAKSVNLLPSDRPQDVYSDVAELVAQRIHRDAENGVAVAQLLKGRVDRKVVKQTVMTSVYGVTFIGARQQITNAMKDHRLLTHLTDNEMYQASQYIAQLTFESLKEMFTGARNIMDWLATCAKLVAKKGRLVSWTTPLGLPVVQPYRRQSRTGTVETVVQSVALEHEPTKWPVYSNRQRSAFPPNFIHSLDSTHMLLTAIHCKRQQITYASVHDSFWTHPATVDDMNTILREKFVQLHGRPILKQLREYWTTTHPDIKFPELPALGKFNLHLVKESPYFFH
jgi:DNA-directed RNA polymerase